MMGKRFLKIINFILKISFFWLNRLDDLIVGAPLYMVKKDGRIISDAGRIDVFYQTRQVGFLFNCLAWKIVFSFLA